MNGAGRWHVVRHVVRAFGHALDERGAALAGAAVTLWLLPEGGRRSAAASGAACLLRGRTQTRPDGLFFFLDCRAGQFVATALGASGAFGTARLRISGEPDDNTALAAVDIACRRRQAAGGPPPPAS